MAIDTSGYLTVAEAAERLNLYVEQLRRKLRAGKFKGRRIGNQWFVDGSNIDGEDAAARPLIPPETIQRVRGLREEANEYNSRHGGEPFNAVEMLRRSRGED